MSGFFIVIGGTLSATLISYPVDYVYSIFKSVAIVLKREPPRLQEYIEPISNYVQIAKREGIFKLEKEIPDIQNLFLQDGIQMLVDGYPAKEINEILNERIRYRIEREHAEAEVLLTMAKVSPAFGMIGTLIGLIMLMANLNEAGMDNIGIGMAIALLTTLYGTLLSNFLFKPFAKKLEMRTKEQVLAMKMLRDSIKIIAEQWHPVKVQDYLNSYLRPGQRAIPDRMDFK